VPSWTYALPLPIAGAVFLAMAGAPIAPAVAQAPKMPAPPAGMAAAPAHPDIDPAALAILKATSQRLTSAKTLAFTAISTYESPARNGQPLYYMTRSDVSLMRPNFLRVLTPGDGPASDFYYDGKTMTAYSPAADLIAVAGAPPTIDAMLKSAYDVAAIYFPFTDVIVDDPYKDLSEGLTYAYVVGQSHVVDDTVTDIVAIANPNVQAEIWIGVDDGLPRMVHATYVNDPTHQRYTVEMKDWRTNVTLTPADFVAGRQGKALLMQFARPDKLPIKGKK